MTNLPEWPAGDGPRILTLAGNDLTIDTRARKTASSLARAGYSVIAIGVDWTGELPRSVLMDGAILYRVVPPSDPRVSLRAVRLSRPEIAERLRYRTEMQRQRLQMSRRFLTAWVTRNRRRRRGLTAFLVRAQGALTRGLGFPDDRRSSLSKSIGDKLDLITFRILYLPRWARTVLLQRRHQVTTLLYKAFVRGRGRRALATPSWRRDLPEQQRFEASVGSIVDYLAPDLIHVHDIFHLGVAARAKARSEATGRTMRIVYDAQEFIPGLPTDRRRRDAYTKLEEEYIPEADAVVTVSESLGQLLNDRYGANPTIVMNAPDLDTTEPATALRTVVGLSDADRIVVYVGGVAPHRGAEILIAATEEMAANVHLVFVTNSTTGYVATLMETAKKAGLSSRVHLAPYVAPEAVVSYIESADVSVIPLSRDVVNYEVALPNKLFQSIHARVPVVVSDNPEMKRFVTELGVGEVFDATSVQSLVDAIETVFDRHPDYVERLSDPGLLEPLTWRAQADRLISLYESVGVRAP